MSIFSTARFWFGVADTTFTLAAGVALGTGQWGYFAFFLLTAAIFSGFRECTS